MTRRARPYEHNDEQDAEVVCFTEGKYHNYHLQQVYLSCFSTVLDLFYKRVFVCVFDYVI